MQAGEQPLFQRLPEPTCGRGQRALSDGSVKFFKNSINILTWRSLGSGAGGRGNQRQFLLKREWRGPQRNWPQPARTDEGRRNTWWGAVLSSPVQAAGIATGQGGASLLDGEVPPMRTHRCRGVTIIDLIAMVFVIAVLLTILSPSFSLRA